MSEYNSFIDVLVHSHCVYCFFRFLKTHKATLPKGSDAAALLLRSASKPFSLFQWVFFFYHYDMDRDNELSAENDNYSPE